MELEQNMKKVQLVRPPRTYSALPLRDQKMEKSSAGIRVGVSTPPMEGVHTPLSPAPVRKAKEASNEDSLGNVLSLAAELTPDQRRELLARLSLDANSKQVEQVRDVDMWAEAVFRALHKDGMDAVMVSAGPALVKRTVGTPQAWRPVSEFMDSSRLATLKVTERQSVYGMLARLVTEHARKVARRSGVPMSMRLVGNCAGNVAGLFDNAFPGYLNSGLALIVARRLTAGAAVAV